MLNGYIEFSKPRIFEKFKAYIKLDKDPLGFVARYDNLILRGSTLRYCDWIFGVVLLAGDDSLIYQNQRDSVLKNFRSSSF
jgi:hypothetical protein